MMRGGSVFQRQKKIWATVRNNKRTIPFLGVSWLLFCMVLVGFVGCIEPLDENGRGAPSLDFVTPQPRNFGEEVYKFIRREARKHPTSSAQRVAAVDRVAADWDMADSINRIVPAAMLEPLDQYLRTLLPFYDNEQLPELVRELAIVLAKLRTQKEVLQALVLLGEQKGLTPPLKTGEGSFLHRMLSFPKQSQMLQQMMTWIRGQDGMLDSGKGIVAGEPVLVKNFLDALSSFLARTNPSAKVRTNPSLLSELLLLEDNRLDLKVGRRCALRFDGNGKAILSAFGKNAPAPLPLPFAASGGNRGECGEALRNGQPIYDVRDLSKTVLGSVLAESRKLILRDLPLQGDKIPFPLTMTVGMRPLMEPIDPNTKGFSKKGALIGMLQSFFPMMRGPRLYKVLHAFASIADKHSNELAAQVAMLKEVADIVERTPNINVLANNKLLEDLLPILQELFAIPGFLEDLLQALQTPGLTQKLEKSLSELMRYRKDKITLSDYQQFKGGQRSAIFNQQTNFNQPDRVGNMSYFQRMFQLLGNVNRISYRSKLKALSGVSIPLIEMRIDNLALLYLRAVADKVSVWDTIFVNGKPINNKLLMDTLRKSLPLMGLSEEPNPEELGLFMNRELRFEKVPLVAGLKLTVTLDPIKDRHGYEVRKHHGDSLLAGLATGIVSKDGGALRPVAKVFLKHKKLARLLDIFGVLSRHWASDANQQKSADGSKSIYPKPRTNLRSIESAVLESVEKVGLFKRLEAFGNILLGTILPDGEKAAPPTQTYIAYVIGKPGVALSQTPLGPMLDSLDAVVKALEGPAKESARKAWEEAMEAMTDLFLKVVGKGAQARFENQRASVILARALDFLAKEVERRDKAGQWGPDLGQMEEDMLKLLTDPILPSTLEMLDGFTENRLLLGLVADMLVYVMPDHQKEQRQFGEFLSMAGAFLVPLSDDIRVPLMRYVGNMISIEKHRSLLVKLVVFLDMTIPLDTQNVLLTLMRNGAVAHAKKGALLFGVFPDVISQINRLQPGTSDKLNVTDLQAILEAVSLYLASDKHGMEKLYALVKGRSGERR